jgi:hypothetical protein
MGCLAAPFKFVGCLGLILLLGVGWLYRDRLIGEVRRLFSSSALTNRVTSGGRPGSHAIISAHAKIDSLNGWRADSVVLTAAEVASLIGAGLDPAVRSQLDSLQVYLMDGSVAVKASLATARLPRELVGPLAVALRSREPVEAAGPIEVVAPRRADWAIQSFRIRNFPVPRDAVSKLVSRALGDSTRSTVPVRIPPGIREIRVRASGATLFGTSRP